MLENTEGYDLANNTAGFLYTDSDLESEPAPSQLHNSTRNFS